MRVESKENNMYTKHPDRVEAYLIRVINRFFNSEMKDMENSREAIINEAVNRMKKELLEKEKKDTDSKEKK